MNRKHTLSDVAPKRGYLGRAGLGVLALAFALLLAAAAPARAQERALPEEQKGQETATPVYRQAPDRVPVTQPPNEKQEAQTLESRQEAVAKAAPAPPAVEKKGAPKVGQVVPVPGRPRPSTDRGAQAIVPVPNRDFPHGRGQWEGRAIRVQPIQRFHVSLWTDRYWYRMGDPVEIYFRATRDAYVYVFDTDASGVTRQIFPNFFDRDNYVQANVTYAIPDRRYSLLVDGPPGRESLEIVAVADRYTIMRRYESFDRKDPYPRREGGFRGLLQGIERDSGAPEARVQAGISGRERSLRVEVVPPYSGPPATASDETSFDVLGRVVERHGKGELRVTSDPSGARIYIDGRYTKEKTSEKFTLSYGAYEVTVEKEGYYPQTKTVTVEPGETTRLYFDLDRIGSRDRPW